MFLSEAGSTSSGAAGVDGPASPPETQRLPTPWFICFHQLFGSSLTLYLLF
jgi:hypothetical protein